MKLIPFSIALGGVLALGGWASAQQAPPGVEPLARGPVHEGYAEAVDLQPLPTPAVPKAPPAPLQEMPPDQKPAGDNVIWIPGYWGWDADRNDFVWVSGFWRVPPPGKTWVPGSWRQVSGGWQWTHGLWAQPEQTQLQYVPAPPAPVESGPSVPAPQLDCIFVPGTWVYKTTWAWRPGYWIDPRPGYVWVPARYRWTPAGYVFLDGYWDYALAGRGLLFAPVYVPRVVYARPFVWTPTVAISYQSLFGALFVYRPAGHYYYGDYFAPRYVSTGFVPWIDFRLGRFSYDPLYGYYHSYYARHDAVWARDLREVYVGRARGLPVERIAVTNVTVRQTVTAPLLAPAVRVGPLVGGLKPVTAEQRVYHQQIARQYEGVAVQRRQREEELLVRPPVGGPGGPRSVRLDLPKTAVVVAPAELRHPPPPSRHLNPPSRPDRPR